MKLTAAFLHIIGVAIRYFEMRFNATKKSHCCVYTKYD